MRYWLMKSEPDEFSIDDLAREAEDDVAGIGVRNYQARNFMRDQMQVGDRAFFYHSSCPEPGIAGIVEVVAAPPIRTRRSSTRRARTTTPKSTRDAPRWVNVDVKLVREDAARRAAELRATPGSRTCVVLQRGQPAVDHAGHAGGVEDRREARAQRKGSP